MCKSGGKHICGRWWAGAGAGLSSYLLGKTIRRGVQQTCIVYFALCISFNSLLLSDQDERQTPAMAHDLQHTHSPEVEQPLYHDDADAINIQNKYRNLRWRHFESFRWGWMTFKQWLTSSFQVQKRFVLFTIQNKLSFIVVACLIPFSINMLK